MAVVRVSELRQMDAEMLKGKLAELRNELRVDKGHIAGGGKATNPGRIKEMRRSIARILTILKEKGVKI
ncbi:MAG: LSU ribosomal protein L29p (L35e) [Candidatus Fermentimicrarchaeum limneticum]|jgi:large subunit ribosomal protein L29|uniref:Large ribosomal subunit protein uL29 n=1 Tax=Fermentimicrarchaeum limneticum TaxID=2795018 RepID=A0A7D6BM34_FERL1|nr:MAG: LSU ribosomal protein L29p (L35e) [Candidatus Fermentimicrarchaeum limneticum]